MSKPQGNEHNVIIRYGYSQEFRIHSTKTTVQKLFDEVRQDSSLKPETLIDHIHHNSLSQIQGPFQSTKLFKDSAKICFGIYQHQLLISSLKNHKFSHNGQLTSSRPLNCFVSCTFHLLIVIVNILHFHLIEYGQPICR